MSVSIHRIYSSVTLIFFLNVFSRVAILPSENSLSPLLGWPFLLSRTDWVYSSSQPGRITLWGARRMKKVSFCRNCCTKCFYMQLFPLIVSKIMTPFEIAALLGLFCGCFVYFCVHSRLSQRLVNVSAK